MTARRAAAAPPVLHVDWCDTCGAQHRAEYSHEGFHGEGPIYAVVCTMDYLVDYYTGERVR